MQQGIKPAKFLEQDTADTAEKIFWFWRRQKVQFR